MSNPNRGAEATSRGMSSNERLIEAMLSHLKLPEPLVDRDADSKVAAFYANRSVFITGATGFLGKGLIEKLIRSCPDIRRIYILVREKSGKSAQERLTELINSKYFKRIRDLNGGSSRVLEEKLYAVEGDITLPKFGISPGDMERLSSDCTLVFNSAATIRFVEPIEVAVKNNVYSVGQLVEFCNELEHLEALIHLSTAYSNCHKLDRIYEIFYEPPMRGDKILETIERLQEIQANIHVYPELTSGGSDSGGGGGGGDGGGTDEPEVDSAAPDRSAAKLQRFHPSVKNEEGDVAESTLLKEFTKIALRTSDRPNTYTLTKAVSESYLLDKVRARPDRYLGEKIPVAIVRPSIVGTPWREPVVGMMESHSGPSATIMGLYTGHIRTMPGIPERVTDMVPVDMVINMVLCTGWFLVEQAALLPSSSSTGELSGGTVRSQQAAASMVKPDCGMFVFNFVSGCRNPLTWGDFQRAIRELSWKFPSKFTLRMPSGWLMVREGRLYYWYDYVLQKVPAYLVQGLRSLFTGQRLQDRSSLIVGYERIRQLIKIVSPFTTHEWDMSDANTHALYRTLGEADKRVFPFDVASVDWEEYTRSYIIGSRIHLLRDEAENVIASVAQLQRWRAYKALMVGMLLVLVHWLFVRYNLICTN